MCAGAACGSAGAHQSHDAEAPATIYAAPDGSASGDGSKARPFDVATAMSASSRLGPGGTLWLRGGTYRVGAITSTLTGAEGAPITVRSAPGEMAVLDATAIDGPVLTLNGAWTIYRDFEVTSSETWRSGTTLSRASGLDVHGAHLSLVNLVVHDLATGFGIWSDAVDTEAYGNIIYYNGWAGPDRPHGHGIYTQNKTGVRRLTDNVVFGQYGIGIHAYASEQGFLDDIQLEGNVVFGNGIVDGNFNILVGGHRRAMRPVLKSNYTYDNPGAGNNVGFAAGCESAVITGNYFAVTRGGYAVQLMNCTGVVEHNVLTGSSRAIDGDRIVTPAELAAQYPANDFVAEPPTVTHTVVRPNRFEPGRAHVIVYNWARTPAVRVDATPAAIPLGAKYTVRDVRNLSATPVASGTYSGAPIAIPVEGLTAAPMVGWQTPPHTAPEFAVFLLTMEPGEVSAAARLMSRVRGLFGR